MTSRDPDCVEVSIPMTPQSPRTTLHDDIGHITDTTVGHDSMDEAGSTRKSQTSTTTSDLQANDKEKEKEKEKEVITVDWDDDDPKCPKNWSKAKKWYITIFSSLLVFMATFASSCPLGGLPDQIEELQTTEIGGTLTLSLFICGYVVGPFIWAPSSEIFGRNPVYYLTVLCFTLTNIPLALTNSIVVTWVMRFVGGTFAASPLTNAGGSISDVWDASERGVAISLFSCFPFMGPVVGPIIGSYVAQQVGWRWNYWIILIFGFVVWIILITTVPETYTPTLLKRRAKKLRRTHHDDRYRAPSEQNKTKPIDTYKIAFTRPFRLTFEDPLVSLSALYVAVVYGTLYLLFEAYPVIFIERDGLTLQQSSLMFIAVGIGAAVGASMQPLFDRVYEKEQNKRDEPFPEGRLFPALFGGPCLCIGLFWMAGASAATGRNAWIAQCLSGLSLGVGFMLVFISFINYLVDVYTRYAASALAANTIARSLFGAGFPLFTAAMYHQLGAPWASATLGFIALILAPIPYAFWRYGTKLRSKSHFAISEQ